MMQNEFNCVTQDKVLNNKHHILEWFFLPSSPIKDYIQWKKHQKAKDQNPNIKVVEQKNYTFHILFLA